MCLLAQRRAKGQFRLWMRGLEFNGQTANCDVEGWSGHDAKDDWENAAWCGVFSTVVEADCCWIVEEEMDVDNQAVGVDEAEDGRKRHAQLRVYG